ncbi:MAG TPA: UDP-N-acetylglucosamine 2-epimerase (non-hydrolyzing) [Ignavibacteria bacterium]|nr:UDP-N-acetylglucosamine 2-epimerase (non-hydrolyzing) [Ignavibacteria bacterium]
MNNKAVPPENYQNKKVILIIFGTRPEIIKLFILYKLLKESEEFYPVFVNTMQQSMSSEILEDLNITVDIECSEIQNRSADLNQFISHIMLDFNEKFNVKHCIIPSNEIAGVIVQGDTASAYSGAIWSFMNKIPVFHVEAGLRTFDHENPFPEEFFRESIARTSSINFCPTHISYDNLVREGINARKNYIVGNTINDAMIELLKMEKIVEPRLDNFILSTLHRRENWNHVPDYARILQNVLKEQIVDESILHLIHPNPIVKNSFLKIFEKSFPEKLIVRNPVHDYFKMLGFVKNSHTILTDSGGLQEESLFFNIPCGIMRKVTERPEVLSRNAKLLPFKRMQVKEFLVEAKEYRQSKINEGYDYTYGRGNSSNQIYDVMKRFYKF